MDRRPSRRRSRRGCWRSGEERRGKKVERKYRVHNVARMKTDRPAGRIERRTRSRLHDSPYPDNYGATGMPVRNHRSVRIRGYIATCITFTWRNQRDAALLPVYGSGQLYPAATSFPLRAFEVFAIPPAYTYSIESSRGKEEGNRRNANSSIVLVYDAPKTPGAAHAGDAFFARAMTPCTYCGYC